MQRIAIIGCGGSGKSHLARQLAAHLDIGVTHLDAVYYDSDWNPLPHEQFVATQRYLVEEPSWIIEGNYASTLPVRIAAADSVVFLDLPARTCLRGALSRRLRHGAGQDPATGVYCRITWGFVRYILNYRRTMRPRVASLVAEHSRAAAYTVLTSRRQANAFVAQAARTAAPAARTQSLASVG